MRWCVIFASGTFAPSPTAGDRCNPRRRALRPRLVVLSTAQSLLYRRGQIQGRDPARRAAGRSWTVHCSMPFNRSSRINGALDPRSGTPATIYLTGLLFDDANHRMVPTHATKAGIRYRYYVVIATPPWRGQNRIGGIGLAHFSSLASKICIVKALNEHLIAQKEKPSSDPAQVGDRKVVLEQVARIDVNEDCITVRLQSEEGGSARMQPDCHCQFHGRSRLPEGPDRSLSRTVSLQVKFVRPGSSDGRAWLTRSHEAVVGLTRSRRAL